MDCLERLSALLLLLHSCPEGLQGFKLLQELRSMLVEVHVAVDEVLREGSHTAESPPKLAKGWKATHAEGGATEGSSSAAAFSPAKSSLALREGQAAEAWRVSDWSCTNLGEESIVACTGGAASLGVLQHRKGCGTLSSRLPSRSSPGLPAVSPTPCPTRRADAVQLEDSFEEELRRRQVIALRKLLRSMSDPNNRLPSDPSQHPTAPELAHQTAPELASSSRVGHTFREMFQVCSVDDISVVAPDCLVRDARRRSDEISILSNVGGLSQPQAGNAPWLHGAVVEGPVGVRIASAAHFVAGKADTDDEDAEATCQRYEARHNSDGSVCWAPL